MAKSATAAATRRPATPKHDDRFGLQISLVAHGTLLFFLLIKGVFFPGKPIPFIPALRVDMVGLPDVLKKDLSKLSKIPAPPEIEKALKEAEQRIKEKPVDKTPKSAPKADDEVGLKQRKEAAAREKKLKSALERMKSLAKIADDEASTQKQTAIIKNNMLSKGTSLSPDARESMTNSYLDLLRDRLQSHWALPVWLARQKLDAQVLLYIDAKGRVTGVKFAKSSGNARFDDEVRNAITKSQPLPPPPDGIETSLLANGVLIGFPL
jgi:TonB family protein